MSVISLSPILEENQLVFSFCNFSPPLILKKKNMIYLSLGIVTSDNRFPLYVLMKGAILMKEGCFLSLIGVKGSSTVSILHAAALPLSVLEHQLFLYLSAAHLCACKQPEQHQLIPAMATQLPAPSLLNEISQLPRLQRISFATDMCYLEASQ